MQILISKIFKLFHIKEESNVKQYRNPSINVVLFNVQQFFYTIPSNMLYKFLTVHLLLITQTLEGIGNS